MSKMLCLLVGIHFRPPAKAIIQWLPSDTPVRLESEAENQYDPNAIRVMFSGKDLPEAFDAESEQQREADFLSQGFSTAEIIESPEEWHLGYIAKSGGKPLQDKPWSGNLELRNVLTYADKLGWRGHTAKLVFGPAGEPLVAVEIADE